MLAFLDCDSTLSSIEGVDELAGLRGGDVQREVAELTDRAMDGSISIGEVFARRLELILPSLEECRAIGQRYIETIEPTAADSVRRLQAAGWEVIVLSGGHTQVIEPLAEHLGISRIEAVRLDFCGEGQYLDFDREYPSTRNGGKPDVIASVKHQLGVPDGPSVMVGDGISDLEVQERGEVDLFIGFGAFVTREPVRAGAEVWATSLREATDHILGRFPGPVGGTT